MYGASKAAADLLVGQMAKRIRSIRVRPFNHTGVGQVEGFVVPAFAAQIARIERGWQPPVVDVGDLSAERDIIDVRDVVDAYVRIIDRFDDIQSGEVVNLCSGVAVSMRWVLETLISFATRQIEVRRDEQRMRPSEIRRRVGDPRHARRLLGWEATIPITRTLREVYDSFLKTGNGPT
jgi:GDP-4-dehydro-6-deoxy-D-mannose reductase